VLCGVKYWEERLAQPASGGMNGAQHPRCLIPTHASHGTIGMAYQPCYTLRFAAEGCPSG
jgi:hypothetical protein